jgi:phosphomannomutase
MKNENSVPRQEVMGIGRRSKKKWQREQLILAMLQQPTWQKAAASIGISEVTAWRIRQTPEFRREYLQARREAVSQSLARLQQGAGAAASTLLKIIVDPSNSAATRVQAASRILEHAKQAFVLEDLALRVNDLEQIQQDQK